MLSCALRNVQGKNTDLNTTFWQGSVAIAHVTVFRGRKGWLRCDRKDFQGTPRWGGPYNQGPSTMATWELLLPGPACLCPKGVKPRHLVIDSFLIHSDHPQRKRGYLPCLKIWVCSLPDNLMRFWPIIPLVAYDAKGVQTQAHNWCNPSSNTYEASLVFPKLSTLQEAQEVIIPDIEDMWYELEDAPLGQKNNKVVTPIIKKDTLSLHSPITKRAHGLGISGPTLHAID